MLKIAVLVSGGGTNLQALLDAQARGEIQNGQIACVISSKPGRLCAGHAPKTPEFREKHFPERIFPLRKPYDHALLDLLDRYQTDLIVLCRIHDHYSENRLSIAYSGQDYQYSSGADSELSAARDTMGCTSMRLHWSAASKLTGATVHFVNEVCDGGPIILQKAVAVLPGDTPETLAAAGDGGGGMEASAPGRFPVL